ncbi:mmc protein [Phlyctema vagabunda]|uniref:Mmc protein n=1 Tax=Phlyctema vagabunda TaxID=108571 RepID=A0ABR4P4L0_9HELO
MKYSLAALAFAAGAVAQYMNGTETNGTVYYTTQVVTALTTFCPSATQLTYNGVIYTITEATTLTVTDCPCTLTHTSKPVPAPSTILYTSCPPSNTGAPPAPPAKTIVPATGCPGGPDCPAVSNPLTVVYSTPTKTKTQTLPTGTGSVTGPSLTSFTGAANTQRVAGVLVAVGVVAAFAL